MSKELCFDQMVALHTKDINFLRDSLLASEGKLNARGVVEWLLKNIFSELNMKPGATFNAARAKGLFKERIKDGIYD